MVRGKNKNEVVYENPVYLNNESSQQTMKQFQPFDSRDNRILDCDTLIETNHVSFLHTLTYYVGFKP